MSLKSAAKPQFIGLTLKLSNRDILSWLRVLHVVDDIETAKEFTGGKIEEVDLESGSYYVASVLELDGCKSHGDTPEEALAMVKDAMVGYLEVKLEYGDKIPEPIEEHAYSGKWLQRAPKSLHKQLMEEAAAEGVSFNQYCLYKLSR